MRCICAEFRGLALLMGARGFPVKGGGPKASTTWSVKFIGEFSGLEFSCRILLFHGGFDRLIVQRFGAGPRIVGEDAIDSALKCFQGACDVVHCIRPDGDAGLLQGSDVLRIGV